MGDRSDLDENQKNLQIFKRRAIGEYEEAGWPSLVIDDNGLPTLWNGRFKLARGKVESTAQRENFQLRQTPGTDTNPLGRVASISDPKLSVLFNTSVYVVNPAEPEGLNHHPNLPASEFHAVHSLQVRF